MVQQGRWGRHTLGPRSVTAASSFPDPERLGGMQPGNRDHRPDPRGHMTPGPTAELLSAKDNTSLSQVENQGGRAASPGKEVHRLEPHRHTVRDLGPGVEPSGPGEGHDVSSGGPRASTGAGVLVFGYEM